MSQDNRPTPPRDEKIARWLAHSEIRAVVERYFYGLDARDAQALSACFTPDAYYEANTGGGRRIVFEGAEAIGTTLARLIGRFEASLHQGSNPAITVEGDSAQVDVFAIARMVHVPVDGQKVVFVRGLRYRDELVLQDGEWKIGRRIHQALWQYDADAIEPHVPPAPGIG